MMTIEPLGFRPIDATVLFDLSLYCVLEGAGKPGMIYDPGKGMPPQEAGELVLAFLEFWRT
jgi:hypothetical protein